MEAGLQTRSDDILKWADHSDGEEGTQVSSLGDGDLKLVCSVCSQLREGDGGKPESALRCDQGTPFHSHHAEICQWKGPFQTTHQNG